jgi:hypothetical protein
VLGLGFGKFRVCDFRVRVRVWKFRVWDFRVRVRF